MKQTKDPSDPNVPDKILFRHSTDGLSGTWHNRGDDQRL